jgi:prolyl oligopeptidase
MSTPLRLLSAVLAAAVTAVPSAPPLATIVPYSQTFYGTTRSDPYHWMESGGPSLTAYIEGQSDYTKSLLATNPGRSSMVHALEDAYEQSSKATTTAGVVRARENVFYLQSLPGSDNPSLQVRADGRASRIVVDAKSLPKDRVIGWFEVSPLGTKIAYGVTAPSEQVSIHVCNADGSGDVAQSIVDDVIPDVTWRDERSFYYDATRQRAKIRDEVSFLHRIGSPLGSDVQIGGYGARGPLGSGSDHDLFITFALLGTDAVVAETHRGASPYESVFVAPFASATSARAPWRRLFGPSDEVVADAFVRGRAYGLSDRGDARRTVLVRDRATGAPLQTIAPNDAGFRTGVFGNRNGLFITERKGAEMVVEQFGASGKALRSVALPNANVIVSLSGGPTKDAFLVETATFRDPGRWYEVRGARSTVRDLGVSPAAPGIYANIRYEDAFATSADGTQVPYTVVYADGTPRDGHRPTIVFGYGAYGIDALEPPTPPIALALVHFGAIFVLAHIRGGGEFGEPWHLAGKGSRKQHTIDDFVACTRAMIATGWTTPSKIAGYGASAGGITIGGAITQHPELYAVAISHAGVNDMVDYENAPNGPGNVPEFGSVKTPTGFRDLLAMSAYDHVAPAAYPATILTTGFADVRVPPWEVAKMDARLQAATTSGKPVLLRADAQGHGLVRDVAAQIDEDADVFTFMLWQFGEPAFASGSSTTSALERMVAQWQR